MIEPTPSLATPYRTHTCGALRGTNEGDTARLAGWVHRRRDHGQMVFLDLRDRHGITQVVVDAADAPDAHAVAARCRPEFVVTVEGIVAHRLPGAENARLATGAIELQARELTILAEAKTPPFYINEPDAQVDESIRLQYRYLDIRREPMLRRLLLRSRLVSEIRRVHEAHGFVEIETPILIKSTPEGARDFIVPSRLQPGTVYALPQSPQQLKQLLMVAGMDRYFQIARCFRDEDLRGDRQPEFTQLDLEMSFVGRGDGHGLRGDDGDRRLPCRHPGASPPGRPLPALHLRRGARAFRYRQAGPPLRHGARRPRPGSPRPGREPRLGLPRLRRDPRGRRSGQGHRGPGPRRRQPQPGRRADRDGEALRRPRPRPPRGRRRRDPRAHREVPR